MFPDPDEKKCPFGALFEMLSVRLADLPDASNPHHKATFQDPLGSWRFSPLMVHDRASEGTAARKMPKAQTSIGESDKLDEEDLEESSLYDDFPEELKQAFRVLESRSCSIAATYSVFYRHACRDLEKLGLSRAETHKHVLHWVRFVSVAAAELEGIDDADGHRVKGNWNVKALKDVFSMVYSTGWDVPTMKAQIRIRRDELIDVPR